MEIETIERMWANKKQSKWSYSEWDMVLNCTLTSRVDSGSKLWEFTVQLRTTGLKEVSLLLEIYPVEYIHREAKANFPEPSLGYSRRISRHQAVGVSLSPITSSFHSLSSMYMYVYSEFYISEVYSSAYMCTGNKSLNSLVSGHLKLKLTLATEFPTFICDLRESHFDRKCINYRLYLIVSDRSYCI